MPVTIMMYLLLVVVGLAVLAVVALIAKVADGNAPSRPPVAGRAIFL